MDQAYQFINTQFLQTSRDYILHLQNLSILLVSAAAIIIYKEKKIKNFNFNLILFPALIVILFLGLFNAYFTEKWSQINILLIILSIFILTFILYSNKKNNYKRNIQLMVPLMPVLAFLCGVLSLFIGLNAFGEILTIILDYKPQNNPDLTRTNPFLIWQICFNTVSLLLITLWTILYKIFNKEA